MTNDGNITVLQTFKGDLTNDDLDNVILKAGVNETNILKKQELFNGMTYTNSSTKPLVITYNSATRTVTLTGTI